MAINLEPIGIRHINTHKGGFVQYARACGTATALAYCRGDRRSVKFEQKMKDVLPTITSQLMCISRDYAYQDVSDWQWLKHIEQNGVARWGLRGL